MGVAVVKGVWVGQAGCRTLVSCAGHCDLTPSGNNPAIPPSRPLVSMSQTGTKLRFSLNPHPQPTPLLFLLFPLLH